MAKKTWYVTTPLYYVNARPHIGSLYSTVLADVLVRWHLLLGQESFLLTGTDEHGQKIAQAAAAAGCQPKIFVDTMAHEFATVWQDYDIKVSKFIRTTDESHQKAVDTWIRQVRSQGDIYKGSYIGQYCVPCETFITSKNSSEKEKGVCVCPDCQRPTIEIAEECYFFKLSAYADKLLDFFEQHPDFIRPIERTQEVISFVKQGLKDLCISRSAKVLSWGIPFPDDETQRVYVWVDALLNYISALGYGSGDTTLFETYWPVDFQVMGKDIVRFHAVYWPAMLMAVGVPCPHHLLVHGWLKLGDEKISKSRGNAIDPQVLKEQYGTDQIRYYLTRYCAITHDAPFSTEELEQRINADLANDLGNLVQRSLVLARTYKLSTINQPDMSILGTRVLYDSCVTTIDTCQQELAVGNFHQAYAAVAIFVSKINAYFHEHEPWKLAKSDTKAFENVMSVTFHALYTAILLYWPVMPRKMCDIMALLGMDAPVEDRDYMTMFKQHGWQEVFTLTLPEQLPVLFTRYEKPERIEEFKKVEQKKKKTMVMNNLDTKNSSYITIDQFTAVDVRIGTVQSVDPIEGSDKLYKLMIDCGDAGVRQICSGVRQFFEPQDLLFKQVAVVVNLAPRKMMGIESQGMVLFAATADNKLALVTTVPEALNGSRLK
jgi:methionyl-tRNA synthetase